MKILLHICCAPCSVACIETLENEGADITTFWYNPNIHPFTEYRARRDCAIDYMETVGIPLIVQDEYGLRTFIESTHSNIDARCEYCYDVRLDAAARYAKNNRFDAFSTSLLISPYQKHDLIREIGERKSEKYGIDFMYKDFRPGFRAGQKSAREVGLYMQKYCGCIFSEEERYLGK